MNELQMLWLSGSKMICRKLCLKLEVKLMEGSLIDRAIWYAVIIVQNVRENKNVFHPLFYWNMNFCSFVFWGFLGVCALFFFFNVASLFSKGKYLLTKLQGKIICSQFKWQKRLFINMLCGIYWQLDAIFMRCFSVLRTKMFEIKYWN